VDLILVPPYPSHASALMGIYEHPHGDPIPTDKLTSDLENFLSNGSCVVNMMFQVSGVG